MLSQEIAFPQQDSSGLKVSRQEDRCGSTAPDAAGPAAYETHQKVVQATEADRDS